MFNSPTRSLLRVAWDVFFLLAGPIAFVVLVCNGVSWMLAVMVIGICYGVVTPSEFALFALLLDRPSNGKSKPWIK